MHTHYASLLLISLPFALVTGPAVPDWIVSLLALYFIFLSRKSEMWFYYRHPIVKIIFLFWIYCIVRSLISSNPALSLESSLFYGRFIFFSLAVAYLLSQNNKTFIYFGWSLLICLIIVTIDAYLQYITGKNIFGWKQLYPPRVSGFFGDELILGSFLARLMPLGFFIIASIPRLKSWMMLLGLIFLMAVDVLIFLSGERVAFFYLILGTLLIIILTINFRWLRFFTFLISIFIIVFLTIMMPPVKTRMIDNTIGDLGINNKVKSLNAFTTTHEEHFSSALNMFYDNPIFGKGPKLFRYLCNKPEFYPKVILHETHGCSTHPHNTYIQLLAELGIVGMLPVLGIFFYIIYLLSRQFFTLYINRKRDLIDDPQVCLLITMLISLWPLIPTGNFFGNWINILYYLPVGFYLYKTSK